MKSHAADQRSRYPDRVCKRALRATADRPGTRLRDLHQGFGRVNVADALRYVTHDLQRPRRT